MTLTKSLLDDNNKFPEPYFVTSQKEQKVIIGIFHYLHGPMLIDEEGPVLSDFVDSLFPDNWKDGSLFISKHSNYFYLCLCAISDVIFSPRGALQFTMAIRGSTPSFSDDYVCFLENAIRELKKCPNLDLGVLNNAINQHAPSAFEERLITHPLRKMLEGNVFSNFFSRNPKSVFELWKARAVRAKIAISSHTSITDCTKMCYFISIMSWPFSSPDDASYLVSLSKSRDFLHGEWNLVALAHPILQNERIAHVTIVSEGNISVQDMFKYIQKGEGSALRTIITLLEERDDYNLLCFLTDLSRKLIALFDSRSIIDSKDLSDIGLDSSNNRFLTLLIQTQHRNNTIIGSCCC